MGSMQRRTSRKPVFADGSVVPDYEPLFRYWELAKERKRQDLVDKAMLSQDDFMYLREALKAAGETVSLLDMLSALTERFVERVDAELAKEALMSLGYPEVSEDEAQRRIAKIIAGWLIEAGKAWNILKLTGSLPRD